jgi:hypothetical protein
MKKKSEKSESDKKTHKGIFIFKNIYKYKMTRIGIVLNFKKAEKKKDELLYVNSRKKPWLQLANEPEFRPYSIMRADRNDELKRHVPVDVALGLYIKSMYPDVVVDFIRPDEISVSRFAQNDIVFLMQYDLLEAYHLDRSNFVKFKKVLEKSNNVYPPYDYQKFINNKCSYYNYLEKHDIPIAPTHCIDIKGFNRNPDTYIENLLEEIESIGWDSFIIKPVYGQESFGFGKFLNVSENRQQIKTKLLHYFNKFADKYTGFIVQKYIAGFDKGKIEARMYFINGKYLFCMATSGLTWSATMRETRPVQEGGTFKISDTEWAYIKRLAKKVMKTLPTFNLKEGMQNSIITRIDIGSGLEGVPYSFFVNEVEFAPSFFIERQDEPVIQHIGDALVKTAEEYKNHKKIKVNF